MAFWGVEVKAGKPFIHRFDSQLGRLRLSSATLGSGSSNKKSIVQCSVGSNPPINLCSLLPEKVETSPLNLEFEEDDEVTFSVVGPTSVHLSGFYYGENEDDCEDRCGLDHYDEDISDSEDESDNSIDFDSIDDFSDEDLVVYPTSRKANCGVKIEEIDNEKPAIEDGSTEHKSNAHPIFDSEDEDGFPKSSTGKSELMDTEKTNEKLLKKKRKNDSEEKNVLSDTKSKQKNKKKKHEKEAVAHNNTEDLDPINATPLAKEEIIQKTTKKKNDKKNKNDKKQDNASDLSGAKNVTTKKGSDKIETEPSQVRTFPNGMVVEELAMGKPDGKKAANGKKVSVRYIGKLKQNGKIFDSNIGKAPFKFRLGVGQVIKGWDVGVNGMRVGDKRRLTIPPSMGYGTKGAGAVIPGNSWLVFDVELIDVN
ncbi:hypothetical protein Leryth_022910 [Lithospermum erythrorhizon]|nr:hypothetical protein Leryth_022910 [Lithospermum erythrorhizon]